MFPKKDIIISLLLSILFHVLIFSLIFLPKHKLHPITSKAENETRIMQVEFLSLKPETALKTTDLTADIGKTKYETDEIVCKGKDKKYVGIGMIYNPGTNIIYRLPQDYPAYKAGLRLGDLIVDPYLPIVNNYLDIVVRRGNEFLSFHIKVENICFQEK